MLLLTPSVWAQRESYNLNRGWTFTLGWDNSTSIGESVDLPHTWNHDALSGRVDYYRGMGNYTKIVDVPKSWGGKRVFIRFGAVGTVCDLYVGGQHIGQHRGGYTAFTWDITHALTYGQRNTLLVRVTNAQNMEIMPIAGDFNIYGGIYRDVEIIVTPQTHITPEEYSSSGLEIAPMSVTDQQAEVNAVVHIKGSAGELVETKFTLSNAAGTIIDSTSRRIQIETNGSSSVAASFTIQSPRLWNSTADPYLYTMKASIASSNATDSVIQDFGVRYFKVDENNQFLLNGRPFRLQGVSRVEDQALIGKALYRENQQRDIELIKEMGANAIRMAYYPNDPYFVELCDRAGIIIWSEIPFTGAPRAKGYSNSEAFRTNGIAQTLEMIHQLYNHPSVIFWGIFNELTQRGDDPLNYVRMINDAINDHDDDRITVAASNQDGDLNFVTDLIGFNQMMGWGAGMPSDVDGWTKQLRRDWPKLKSGLSAYGAGASIYQHEDSLIKPMVEGSWHPEEWQTFLHEQYWDVIRSKPYFWGTFVWTMFDYGVASYRQGPIPGLGDTGLVTFDRSVRKDAFYFYKANWNSEDPFVYISERRWQNRQKPVQTIKIFSNQADIELFVNGVSLGIKSNDGLGRFIWTEVPMKIGANSVEAADLLNGKRDQCTINIITTKPLNAAPSAPVGAVRSTLSNKK